MSRDIDKQLVKYLSDAHAMEQQSLQALEKAVQIAGDPDLEQLYRGHHNDTVEHLRYVRERLEALGASPSTLKDAAGTAAAKTLGLVAQGSPDTPATLAAVAYALESFEVGSYQLLRRVAERAGDDETVAMVDRILPTELQARQVIEEQFDLAVQRSLEAVGVEGG